MRGTLNPPEANHLKWIAYLDLFLAGWNAKLFVQTTNWISLVLAILLTVGAIAVLIKHWGINHPKIPKWAEEPLEVKEVIKGG
jgi:hypothetical protein